jgi:hypothetical protein
MPATRFDTLILSLAHAASRRLVLPRLTIATLSLAIASRESVWLAAARQKKNKNKKRKRRPNFNAFGCLNVGQACRGNDALCCSGICSGKRRRKGKRGRKGKRDRSRCVAHGERGCLAGQQLTGCGGMTVSCTTVTGLQGSCRTTTGNAGYCAGDGQCRPCTKDADCRPFCGPEAACTVCTSVLCPGGTICVGPIDDGCTFPP